MSRVCRGQCAPIRRRLPNLQPIEVLNVLPSVSRLLCAELLLCSVVVNARVGVGVASEAYTGAVLNDRIGASGNVVLAVGGGVDATLARSKVEYRTRAAHEHDRARHGAHEDLRVVHVRDADHARAALQGHAAAAHVANLKFVAQLPARAAARLLPSLPAQAGRQPRLLLQRPRPTAAACAAHQYRCVLHAAHAVCSIQLQLARRWRLLRGLRRGPCSGRFPGRCRLRIGGALLRGLGGGVRLGGGLLPRSLPFE
mmetsp:Transcript_21284/g.82624  ORF Transcript_21284/g.82624 Transcript_21284/m.82624 type:complete len:255 (+) Transcript_21284:64-828(+)